MEKFLTNLWAKPIAYNFKKIGYFVIENKKVVLSMCNWIYGTIEVCSGNPLPFISVINLISDATIIIRKLFKS